MFFVKMVPPTVVSPLPPFGKILRPTPYQGFVENPLKNTKFAEMARGRSPQMPPRRGEISY